jgi:RNA polymerase sigma-70 factor (ECF subfamily)
MTQKSLTTDPTELLARAREGDRSAAGALLESQRGRLLRLLASRLSGRLGARVDAADVIQDVFLEASRRMEDYFREPEMPFDHWVLFLATQRLQAVYRKHLGTQKRDARREVSLYERSPNPASSRILAERLPGTVPTPSQRMVRTELRTQVRETLEGMEPAEREVIALRNFEQLGNEEVAQVLGLKVSTASKRYQRAIRRLRGLLARIPGMAEY